MRVELRSFVVDGVRKPRALVLVAESKDESTALDEIFGDQVGKDDVVGQPRIATAKLSDGYGEHYIMISKP